MMLEVERAGDGFLARMLLVGGVVAPRGTWSPSCFYPEIWSGKFSPRRAGLVQGWGSSSHCIMIVNHLYPSWLAEDSKDRHMFLGTSDSPNLAQSLAPS